jgi:lipoate-protein ligase A
LQESVAEHAISALLENLHQSQEKQEEKVADIAEDTTTATSSEEDETEISPETFEQLAPPEVEELLEIEGSLESE